jgi:shikimate dehydrogenase
VAGVSHYAVAGDPVEHSLSPRLFRWLFGELGMNSTYSLRPVSPEALPAFVQEVRGGVLNGASITLPHKESVLQLVDRLDPLAGRIGAVNCLFRSAPGRVEGHNTDAAGFRLGLERAGVNLRGAAMLLFGAGGAARAAAASALDGGVDKLVIANRTEPRARSLAEHLSRSFGRERIGTDPIQVIPLQTEAVAQALSEVQLVVNATSAGLLHPKVLRRSPGTAPALVVDATDARLDPAATPLPEGCQIRSSHTVMDMVYQPLETSLLAQARRARAQAVDGLWMLIYQALEQLRLWTSETVPPSLAGRLHQELAKENG